MQQHVVRPRRMTSSTAGGVSTKEAAGLNVPQGSSYDDDDDDLTDADCKPEHRWQTTQYPSCNLLHELTSSPETDLSFIDYGSINMVFGLDKKAFPYDQDGVVLKALVDSATFDTYRFEVKRREAVVLERLSSSPYVPPIYGFCGTSTIAPLSKGGTLLAVIDSIRRGSTPLEPIQKLAVGVQVARGLASLHGIDVRDGSRPSYAHNDVDVSQFVFQDGVFQLNDFNFGKFVLYDSQSNDTCKETSDMAGWKYRAPEDLANLYHRSNAEPFELAKADVYSLCNVLYMIYTNQWLWEGETRLLSVRRILRGELPPIPKLLENSKDAADQAMMGAMKMCYHYEPSRRATAFEIATFLSQELCKLDERQCDKDKPVRVKLPPMLDGTWDDDDYDVNM